MTKDQRKRCSSLKYYDDLPPISHRAHKFLNENDQKLISKSSVVLHQAFHNNSYDMTRNQDITTTENILLQADTKEDEQQIRTLR